MFSQLRLEIAVRALDAFWDHADAKYGDPYLREFDTVKYLNQIDYMMTADDRATLRRISLERHAATIAATDAEVDAVLDARREYNREPEVNTER